jgi:hypothetical protein
MPILQAEIKVETQPFQVVGMLDGGESPLAQGFEHGVLERLCYLFHGEKTKKVYHYEWKEHKNEKPALAATKTGSSRHCGVAGADFPRIALDTMIQKREIAKKGRRTRSANERTMR